MHRVLLHTVRAVAFLVASAAGALLLSVLLWLAGGRGYVACGKTVFDQSFVGWAVTVLFLLGLPGLILLGAVQVVRHYSRSLSQKERTLSIMR